MQRSFGPMDPNTLPEWTTFVKSKNLWQSASRSVRRIMNRFAARFLYEHGMDGFEILSGVEAAYGSPEATMMFLYPHAPDGGDLEDFDIIQLNNKSIACVSHRLFNSELTVSKLHNSNVSAV